VHNFDVLVGICLSETKVKNSGELICWPGSHDRLASWLARDDNMENLKAQGNALLPTGKKSKELFDGLCPHSCLAKPGDVFLANYMVAHAIAPNASPNIRYAVYFRVKGPNFCGNESMLYPWINWRQEIFNGHAGGAKEERKGEAVWEEVSEGSGNEEGRMCRP
jgi:hypothetical protein